MSRLDDCVDLLSRKSIWGTFPRDMRALYLAQRGRCPYCPKMLPVQTATTRKLSQRSEGVNRDHVWPRRLRRSGEDGDIVLCHMRCNTAKGDRHPHPCEVMFARFVTEIASQIERFRHA